MDQRCNPEPPTTWAFGFWRRILDEARAASNIRFSLYTSFCLCPPLAFQRCPQSTDLGRKRRRRDFLLPLAITLVPPQPSIDRSPRPRRCARYDPERGIRLPYPIASG